VGLISFIVDFATLVTATELMNIPYLYSAVSGFTAGVLTNYILSISWVFPDRSLESRAAEVSIFVIVGVIGLALTELILYIGTAILGLDYRVSKLVAVAAVLFWNFGLRKTLLFNART
jgi:putative flippase GtrA